jgi:tetratricopeptide (TPR) repeat protein
VAELGELLFQEQERAVFLQVEPEIDLSALLDSLQAQATLRGFRVHHARPCSRSLPFEAFGDALLALEDPEFPDSDAPAWDDLGILPSIAREAYLDAAELALGEAPVLFLFEGIEALDALSRALLLRLLRSGQSHRFVLASEGPWCLPIEAPPRLPVQRLRGYELEALLKATLAVSRLPSGLVEAFQERGQHDPWTLEQQLASLLERGFLVRDGEGLWRACRGAGRLGAADLLPIDRLLPERLERVPAVARRLLAAVALLREPAPLPWLLRVADLEAEEPAALEALEWLLRNRWLLRGSSKLLGLSVGAVEGPAVALLDGVERQRMHERALLLFRGASGLWSLGRALGHAKEAGDPGTSIDLHEEVGRLAWRQGGPREAGYHWQEAHALAVRFRAPALRLARLLRRRGIALAAVGDEPQAHQLTSQALQHLDASRPALPLALRAWSSGPKASDELSREQVLAHTQLALLLTPSSSDRLRAAWSALQLAEQLPAVPRSLALAQGVLEELIERTPLGTLSLPGLQQARRRLQQQATPPQEAVRWVRQGLFLLKQGRWPQAEQALRRGASRAQRLRAQSLWLFAVTHLALALLVQGELGQAEDLAETFVVHAFDEPDAAWLARCLRAEVALVQGRHAQALDRLVAPAPSSGRLQARVQGLRSLALLRAGQADAALQAAAQVTLDHPSLLDAEALLCALQVLCDARALRAHAPLLIRILAALRPLAEEAPILAPRLHLVDLLTGQGRHRVEAILEEARRMDLPYASAQALRVLGQQRHDQGAEEALREAEALLRRLRG